MSRPVPDRPRGGLQPRGLQKALPVSEELRKEKPQHSLDDIFGEVREAKPLSTKDKIIHTHFKDWVYYDENICDKRAIY